MTYRSNTTYEVVRVPYRTQTNCTVPPSLSPEIRYAVKRDYISSGNSLRVNGHLKLRPNSLTRIAEDLVGSPVILSKIAKNPTDPRYSCAIENVSSCFSLKTFVPSFSHESILNSEYLASAKWFQKAANMKLNAAQAYAERKKTINMVASTCRRLTHLYRSLKNGRNPFTGRPCDSRYASSLWLEYTYGWVPLVQDVYGAFDFAQGEPPPISVKTSAKSEYIFDRHVVQSPSSTWPKDITERFIGSSRSTVFAKIVITEPALKFTAETGLTNPALLAWELLPYSFVVDWFLPIGNWLEGLGGYVGIGRQFESVTSTIKGQYDLSVEAAPINGSVSLSGTGSLRGRMIYKSRKTTAISLPMPRVKSPLSGQHALSALALLRVAFKN